MLLNRTLMRMKSHAEKEIDEAKHDTADAEIGKVHNVYYCLQTRSHARWGQQEALLSGIQAVGCKIIDFREFHPIDHVGTQHVVDELYLKDLKLKLVLKPELDAKDMEQVNTRKEAIISEVK